jgi:hypothetical protein
MGERFGVPDVVDGDDLEIRLQLVRGPIDVPADPSETVDTDLDGHLGELLFVAGNNPGDEDRGKARVHRPT